MMSITRSQPIERWSECLDQIVGDLPGTGAYDIEALSSTNNLVFSVVGDTYRYCIKIFVDDDQRPEDFVFFHSAVSTRVRTPSVIDSGEIELPGSDDKVSYQVLSFVDGRSVADLLEDNRISLEQVCGVVDCQLAVVDCLFGYPYVPTGVGIQRPERTGTSLLNWLHRYVDRYVSRFSVVMSPIELGHVIDAMHSMISGFPGLDDQLGLISFDPNLKNFMIDRANDDVVVLNAPILAWSTRLHGLACISVQWRGTTFYKYVSDTVRFHCGSDLVSPDQFEFWELLSLIGISSFYLSMSGSDFMNAKMWGGDELLWDHVLKSGKSLGVFGGNLYFSPSGFG